MFCIENNKKNKSAVITGASSKKQKESSLILRKAKFQAIFEFVRSSASGGAGGGKYNRISAFVSMPVLLIRRSREKFFKKNFRDDFSFSTPTALGVQRHSEPKDTFYRHPERSEGSIMNNIKDWILRFANAPLRMTMKRRLRMTIPALALIFTLATTAESRAECRAVKEGWASSCKTLEPSGTCGTGCNYTYNPDTKTVYITATGNDAKIGNYTFNRSYYENHSMPAQTFVINGAVKIGVNAFSGSKEVISGANGALILTGVEHHGFGDNATLSGTIIISEGAIFDSLAFHGVTLTDNAKIYCGVENCKQKMIDSCNAWGDENDEYRQRCLAVVNNMGAKLLAYPDGCMKMGASGCTKCKNENFKLNDGECDRLRWTPAEAAKVLTDDNSNSVTITFRK